MIRRVIVPVIRRVSGAAALLVATSCSAIVASSASADDFYKGRTLQIIVGYGPGGGFDTRARILARHIGKHIPGNPSVVVLNKSGAGGLVAANYVANVSAPDGLTMASSTGDLPLMQAIGGSGIELDVRTVNWIGGIFKTTLVCTVMGFTGVRSWDEIVETKRTIQMGASRKTSNQAIVPLMMGERSGADFKLVVGFQGTAPIRIALERKELDGACWNWDSMKVIAGSMLSTEGDLRLIPFAQSRLFPDPQLENIPLIEDLIPDPDMRAAYQLYKISDEMPGPYLMRLDVPNDRVETIRRALKETLDDPQFLADAKRSGLDFEYVSPDEIQQYIKRVFSASHQSKKILSALTGTK